MAWFYLGLAILFDVAGTVCLKLSHGFSRLTPTILTFVAYGLSLVPLALAVKDLPVGLVYAIWSALGTLLVFAIGIIWFEEPANAVKLGSLVLIVVGLFLLNWGGRAPR